MAIRARPVLDRASKEGNTELVLFLSLDYGNDAVVIVASRLFTVRVDNQPDSNAIVGWKLRFNLMSELNQSGGKEHAVQEINRFLRVKQIRTGLLPFCNASDERLD